jgi:hypothetical protein
MFSFHCKRYCRQHGAYLAKIEGPTENAWILTRVPKGSLKNSYDTCNSNLTEIYSNLYVYN